MNIVFQVTYMVTKLLTRLHAQDSIQLACQFPFGSHKVRTGLKGGEGEMFPISITGGAPLMMRHIREGMVVYLASVMAPIGHGMMLFLPIMTVTQGGQERWGAQLALFLITSPHGALSLVIQGGHER